MPEPQPVADSPNSAPSNHHELPNETVPVVISASTLSSLTPEAITNAVICDVWKELSAKKKKNEKKATWLDVSSAFHQVYGKNLSHNTLRSHVKRVYDMRINLGKSKRDKHLLDSFLKEIYVPPFAVGKSKMFAQSDVVVVQEPPPKRAQLDALISDAKTKAVEDVCKENASLRQIIETKEKEVVALNNEIDELKHKHDADLQELKQKYDNELHEFKQKYTALELTHNTTKTRLKNLYTIIGNVSKAKCVVQTMKRRKKRIQTLKNQAQNLRKAAKSAQAKVQKCDTQGKTVKRLKTQKANSRLYAKKRKSKVCKNKVDSTLVTNQLQSTAKTLRVRNDEVIHLQNELCTKEEELEEQRKKKITVRKGSKITPSMKEASMRLQSIGVAEKNVGPAITAIVSSLTDSTFEGPLPSNSTQQRISSEMRAVAKQQLRETLEGEENLTLKYDGTTKKGRHIVEVEVETTRGSMMVGGMETAGGTAKDYVDCIKTVLDDVDPAILKNVKNTMTDRCIVNKSVDKQIGELIGTEVNSFRCQMHPLDTIHKSSEKFVKAHELTLEITEEKMPFQNRGESRTQALLRAVDKLFHDSGCGLPKDLPYYIKQQGFRGGENTTLYPRWVGNRFNIFFVNAGLVYTYQEHIQEFFSKVMAPRNGLHLAVKNALADGSVMPILRALGLVDKYLTGPWMRWQGEHINILDTCNVFTSVLDRLDGISGKDLVCRFNETAFGFSPKKDRKYEKLIESTVEDDNTASVVDGLLHEAEAVMRRQLEDYLPGGKFHSPSDELVHQAQSCSSNNISGERIFAKIDAKQNQAQSAKLSKTVSKALFSANKCDDFLTSKTPDERAKIIINNATKEAAKDRLKDKKWEDHLHAATRERLNASRQQILYKEQHKRDEKEKIFEVIMCYGVWESGDEVENGTKELTKTKSLEVLKAQIRLRSDILGCKLPSKIIYSKSTLEEVKTYLTELIQVPIPDATIINIIKDNSSIVGFKFNQKWSVDGKDTMCQGSIADIVHVQNKESEFKCVFDSNEECFQTVAELLADIAVGDLFLFI